MSRFQRVSARSAALLAGTFLFINAFFITACTRRNQVDYGLPLNQTLRWNIITEPPTLDWTLMSDTTSSRIADAMMDGLVRYGFKNGKVQVLPDLAASWRSSNHMKTWTFTLRQDVKWTDGVPFTGQQIIDSWQRLLNPKTAALYANYLFIIKNAKAYFEGKIKNFSKVGVRLNKKGELVVNLARPESFFPAILGNECTFPIRKDIIAKWGNHWTDPSHIQTLGAYKLIKWDHGKAVVLQRNDGYFGRKPKIKYILGLIVQDQSTALSMFNRGQLDALDEIPSDDIRTVRTMPQYRIVTTLGVYYFGLNVKMPPLNNVKVRQAINMAINRDQINKIMGGSEMPATTLIPPGLVGYNPNIGPKYDPAKARKLLDEAGYKDRSKFPRLKIAFNTDENHERIAEIIQEQLKTNLGIKVELTNEEWKTYLRTMQAKAYPMFRFGWIADYPDANTFMNLFESDNANNDTNWANKKYDHLVREAATVFSEQKRQKLYDEAQELLLDKDSVVVPIYFYRSQYLVSSRIKNYPLNSLMKFYPQKMEIVK